MASSGVLRERSGTLHKLLAGLMFHRSMGGGPRTFPGGLNKWQYKRMHEKMAMDKERRLLGQEKQIYQARLRSEIRAKRAGKSSSDLADSGAAMTSKAQVKALADRFMKEGAEDLWNEDDGPIRSRTRQSRAVNSLPPHDLRKLMAGRKNLIESQVGRVDTFGQRREYSTISKRGSGMRSKTRWRRNSSSEEDSESEEGVKAFRGTNMGTRTGLQMFPRLNIANEGESEEESDMITGASSRIRFSNKAALRNFDTKAPKRLPKSMVGHDDLSNEIQEIRNELRAKKAVVNVTTHANADHETIITNKRFADSGISPLTIKALTDARYIQMTVVQDAALPVCLDGKDALVKAKTGTGKSVAFLIPAIETVIKAMHGNMNQRIPQTHALILCPTRELAIQVAAEANALLRHHDGIGVQTLIGGVRFKMDQKRLESNPCQIIVATPGRLLDHIENRSGFSIRLMGLKMLVLDEADHLLDLGFRKDIEKIVDSVPRQRQSLLFSATIPKEVRRVSQLVLKRDHIFVDTVGLGGVETHEKVLQSYIIAPHQVHFHLVYHILKEHLQQESDYKVIVFCTTAMVTAFLYVILRDLKMNVREIHSRKPQLYRTRISDEFRESKCIILVTSDVSARGMDYPDVTLVIQVGIPPDREQYIHRLGRTGREGKSGKGILVLAPWEAYFMDQIKDLPIQKCHLPDLDPVTRQKVEDSIGKVDSSIKEGAYHAWLGYYNSIRDIGRDKTTLAELANQFCHSIGLEETPALFRKTALKMGLKDIPGIRIRK
ncbi:probable DEAD-box ATP-dependent RNA helicase 48 [Zingiber officinale]|uniref:probable DEAD-box ATP-dependent RNA helicase 48 n=1 Tax=Zingiber officinale TaxID=94328 RepID=UPI001C4B3D88|nr:probable DEAD-box ATP-dependent RNA helicase 48 [Zingiber officinale]